MNTRNFTFAFAAAVLATAAAGQGYVDPAKGQTPKQQKTNEGACPSWAVQQTGFDPARTPPPPQQPETTATGTTPGAGLRAARAAGRTPRRRNRPRSNSRPRCNSSRPAMRTRAPRASRAGATA